MLNGAAAGRDKQGDRVALVQGASRGIGLEMVRALLEDERYGQVFATCRDPANAPDLEFLRATHHGLRVLTLDVLDERTISQSADAVQGIAGRIDLLVNASGVLHENGGYTGELWPEKRLSDVKSDPITTAFRINALGALLVARAFETLLKAGRRAQFVALSARVGSIGDNRSGGWYAYRTSKAALNMMVRTLGIEWSRLPRPIGCYALHPGTVATTLSEPFRKNLSRAQVFDPDHAAEQLLSTIQNLPIENSGGFYAYDGSPIPW